MNFTEIRKGLSHELVISEMDSDNVMKRMLGIMHASWLGDVTQSCREKLNALKSDKEIDSLSKIPVCDYAYAALDLLGIECYTGERKTVKKLIEANFFAE